MRRRVVPAIAGSFQGTQTEYMYDALARLGRTFVGVIQVPATVTDAEILKLNAAGVRAVRFTLYRGGSAGIEDLDRLARRVHDIAGWHTERVGANRGRGGAGSRRRSGQLHGQSSTLLPVS